MRLLRAGWRLLGLLLQLSAVVLEMAWRFPRLSEERRHACIQRWSAQVLRRLGVSLVQQGRPLQEPCLLVANHVSWLDILAVHATAPQARFVSKADVLAWPVLGWLIRSAGTLFIERERKRDAMRVVHHMTDVLRAGDTVAIFPEGTTGAGPEVLPFHANLLQAALSAQVPVQPVALRYREPEMSFSWAAQYIDDTTLVQSIWRILCAQGLSLSISYLPVLTEPAADRRQLAAALRDQIQRQVQDELVLHPWPAGQQAG